jgi:hypothetical protein
VNPNTRLVPWPATLVAAVLLVVLPAAHGRADPAPAALPADKPEQEPNAQVEAQLELARKRLEEATREVARLSEQMSGLVMDQGTPSSVCSWMSRLTPPGHACTRSHREGRPPRQACMQGM